MKNEVKPIDKSKKSNKRCINCEFWDKATVLPMKFYDDPDRNCDKSGKDINYWNCCKMFQWNPNKLYKEESNDTRKT